VRIAAVLAAIVVALLFASFAPRQGFSDKSVVLILTETGKGSAVHIGGGKFLTAAHVIGANKTVTITAGKQGDPEFKANVLWASEKFDIALIETTEANSFATARLSCREPNVREAIESIGFPGPFGITHTFGFIAGATEYVEDRPLISSNVVLYPGMSGGPAIDKDGYVVAFNNSIALVPLGQTPSLSGLTFLVPASAACKLLARV
jgi:S1-C subfamily serine protease